ncbi:MAG: hypothetical protein AB1454_13715 [Candidatus Auribacterota bacterium]
MKRLIIGLISGCILAAVAFSSDVIGAERGLWVWSISERIVDDFVASDSSITLWEDFISFIEAPHGNPDARIANVYMSTYTYTILQPEYMRLFLAEMNSRGFKVYIVLADPEFSIPRDYDDERGNIRPDFEEKIDKIITFQKKSGVVERYAGIMLDMEPHLLQGPPGALMDFFNPNDFPVIWSTYLNDLEYGWEAVQEYNTMYEPDMTFSDAVAWWYDIPVDRNGDGTLDNLANDIIQYVSYYTVQAYRETSVGIQSAAEGEMVLAATADPDFPKQCLIGVETIPVEPISITFWEQGNEVFETALSELETIYQDNDAFAGFAIHAYEDSTIGKQGYQHLESSSTSKAPVITITFPNGVPLDGISFSDDFTVEWDVFNPDNQSYDVEISYKKQSEVSNQSVPWNVLYTGNNIPASTKSGSTVFDIEHENESTTSSDRLILRASISYNDNDAVTTYDHSNYGIGVNEVPDKSEWSDPLAAPQPGYAQSFQVIADNEGTLHGTFYYGYTKVPAPGVYYTRSTDGGSSWSTVNLSPDTYDPDTKGTWPRKPSIAKRGSTVAVAWIEDTEKNTFNAGFTDRVIYAQLNTNNGADDGWLAEKVTVANGPRNRVGYPQVIIDNEGAVHITWSASYDGGVTAIEHARFVYNGSTGEWDNDGVEPVAQSALEILNTPSMHYSNNTLHCAWGAYKKEEIESTLGEYVFEETFEQYSTAYPLQGFEWTMGGEEFLDHFVQIYNNNKYLVIPVSSPSGGVRPWVSFSLRRKNAWNPPLSLDGARISLSIKSDFINAVPDVMGVQIYTTEIGSTQKKWFGLNDAMLQDIPSSAEGWKTLTFEMQNVAFIENIQKQPDYSKIENILIGCFQMVNDYYANNNKVYIDSVIIQEASSTNTIPASMRIMSRSKTGSAWEDEQEVYTREYDTEQLYSGASSDFENYPVYFPKITSNSSHIYIVWQDTKVGTPGVTDLPEFSNVYFAKRDISAPPAEWDNEVLLAQNAYAPAISLWDNGDETIQVVYGTNYQTYIVEDTYSGELAYKESINAGLSWSGELFVDGSGEAGGIRRPYICNTGTGMQGQHIASYPFIYTDENGITTTCWVNGGQHLDGTDSTEAEEIFKVRNTIVLQRPASPFSDVRGNNGFFVQWTTPPTSYAPIAYRLRRIANNDPATITYMNSGDSIYALSYSDNDSIQDNVHYRYEVSYVVDHVNSPWSVASNVVTRGTDLLLEDFELDTFGSLYTGNDLEVTTQNAPMTAVVTDETADSGDRSFKVTFIDNDTASNKGSIASIIFPSVMDLSGYSSIELGIKFNPSPGMIERTVKLTVMEDGTKEAYQVGSEIMLENDGEWHTYQLFLDQLGKEEDSKADATIDLNKIRYLNIVAWNNGSTSFYIDNIWLRRPNGDNVILSLSPSVLNLAEPIKNQAEAAGFMINQPLTPLVLEYGNAREPWVLRIYTPSEITNNSGDQYIIRHNGLVRYDRDTDTVYPTFNMPVKVWCSNFGPDGFLFDNDTIANPAYRQLGYPPIDNDYFFRGYDFNQNKTYELLPRSDDFVEGTGEGEYPFDLDGDGFKDNDHYFTEGDGRPTINEEPVWLFVPVLKHESVAPDPAAVVMDPADQDTWRILIDSLKGAGKHSLELYFSVFLGEEQIMNGAKPNGYGDYTGVIIVDLAYN